jgi:hypothetical protein
MGERGDSDHGVDRLVVAEERDAAGFDGVHALRPVATTAWLYVRGGASPRG